MAPWRRRPKLAWDWYGPLICMHLIHRYRLDRPARWPIRHPGAASLLFSSLRLSQLPAATAIAICRKKKQARLLQLPPEKEWHINLQRRGRTEQGSVDKPAAPGFSPIVDAECSLIGTSCRLSQRWLFAANLCRRLLQEVASCSMFILPWGCICVH